MRSESADRLKEIHDFFGRLGRALEKDKRYKEDVYLFVMAALARAVQSFEKPRHVTGRELLKFIRVEAAAQFGPMARTVLEHWGIKNSLDFGHVVFNMVHEGILSKTENDSLNDFEDALFLENLFDEAEAYQLTRSPTPGKRCGVDVPNTTD